MASYAEINNLPPLPEKPEPHITVKWWGRGKDSKVMLLLVDYYVNHGNTWQPYGKKEWFVERPPKGYVENFSVTVKDLLEALDA